MSRFKWILLLVLVLIILAFKFLPWYVLIGLAVVLVFGAPLLGRWALFRLFLMPFKAKGSVLRDASVTVHALAPMIRPTPAERKALGYEHDDDEEDQDDEGEEDSQYDDSDESPIPRSYWKLDVTITPQMKPDGFQHWEPGELRLIRPDTKPMSDDDDDACEIVEVEIDENGKYQRDEGFKLQGEQKLRLVLAVQPGIERLAFQYYFEKFGEVKIPSIGIS